MTRYTLPPDTTFDDFVAAMRPPDYLLRITEKTPKAREWQLRWLAFLAESEAQDTQPELLHTPPKGY